MADELGLWPRPEWLARHDDDPSYEWARVAWAKASGQPGAWFDHAKADLVVAKWPEWFRLTEDRFAGVPFRLTAWQAISVRLMVGWKIPADVIDPITGEPTIVWVRLYRRLLLWIPRKNGKSEFLAALGLLFWAYDALVRGWGFVFARKEEQARIIFDKMKAMIGYSADLGQGTICQAKSIYLKEKFASFLLLSGSGEGSHGKGPYVVLGDEMHEWRSAELAENLHQGMGTKLQPVEAYASTAGIKRNLVGKSLWDESTAILEGRIDDATTLVIIYAADPEDDPWDEATWRKANPSLGLSPTLQYVRLEAAKAKGNPRAESRFKRYHLNIWVDAETRWLPKEKWDACAGARDGWKHYPETLLGRTAFAAFDVSSTRDVTALVLVFPPNDEDPKYRVLCRFWVPEDTLEQRVRDDRVDYDKWRRMLGHNGGPAMEITPGDYVDQNYVMRAILEANGLYDLVKIGYDPWNSGKLIADLEEEGLDATKLVLMRQGIQTLGEPSKHFERLVFKGDFDHGNHPVLRWMALNTVIRRDENENFAPAKKRSPEKIDGIVASVMAVGLACAGDDGESGSYVENEPVLMV